MTEETIEVPVAGGGVLVGRWWNAEEGVPVRGRAILVHGLGEHGGRYPELVGALRAAGWGVVAVDQRGHGRSPGRRGVLRSFGSLLDDLAAVRRWVVERGPTGAPNPVLYGHSLGGLVALRSLQTAPEGWRAAVLSAPWLATAARIPWWKRAAEPLLARVLPDLTVSNGLRGEQLTRDPRIVDRWAADGLVHDRVSAGLAATVAAAQDAALAAPPPEGVPTLLLLPTADPVADAGTARSWGEQRGGNALETLLVEGGVHEPHNDIGRAGTCAQVARWLSARTGG